MPLTPRLKFIAVSEALALLAVLPSEHPDVQEAAAALRRLQDAYGEDVKLTGINPTTDTAESTGRHARV